MILRIKRWRETFEISGKEPPKKGLRFFGFPVDAEGLGWRKLSAMEDGRGALFLACWTQMLSASARLDSERRGLVLREDGTPYTPQMLYERFGLCSAATWAEAIAFFSNPSIGWLIDEDAAAEVKPSKVLAMPLPKIEEPSIYEQAAERMIARYVEADAPVDRIPDAVSVAKAILFRIEGKDGGIELMEENQQAYIAETKARYLTRLDHWIAGGLSLAVRKGPKKYERGSHEALVMGEVRAGRMTPEEAREQGVQV